MGQTDEFAAGSWKVRQAARPPELYLADILEAGQAIPGYLAEVSFAQFRDSHLLFCFV